jgi:transposase-like protein
MLEEASLTCPYCGEPLVLEIEPSADAQRYVEDCEVCCRPMVVEVVSGPAGTATVSARRDDE